MAEVILGIKFILTGEYLLLIVGILFILGESYERN